MKLQEYLNKEYETHFEWYNQYIKKLTEQWFINRIWWDFVSLYKNDFLQNQYAKYLEAYENLSKSKKISNKEILEQWIGILEKDIFKKTYASQSTCILSLQINTIELDCNIQMLNWFKDFLTYNLIYNK
jgi:hypothetical protein